MTRDRVKVIGLLGGIAAGKSAVAVMFARLGAEVIDADAIAKDVLASPEIAQRVAQAWGADMLDAQGRPDRARIAKEVFGDPEKLRRLTGWIHPPTLEVMRGRLDRALADADVPLVVIDAPLVLEGPLKDWCDALVFVEAGAATRNRRARQHRAWTEQEIERRETHQISIEEKRRRADAVVRNDGPPEEAFAQVEELFRTWTKSPVVH